MGLSFHRPFPKKSWTYGVLEASRNLIGPCVKWNEGLGIWELDSELKILQRTLTDVQEQIIEGRTVKLAF